MLNYITKPENLNNAALKTRSCGKAGYVAYFVKYFANSNNCEI